MADPKSSTLLLVHASRNQRLFKNICMVLIGMNLTCLVASLIIFKFGFVPVDIQYVYLIGLIILMIYFFMQKGSKVYLYKAKLIYGMVTTLIIWFVIFIFFVAFYYVIPIQNNTLSYDDPDYDDFVFKLYEYLIMELVNILFVNLLVVTFIFYVNKASSIYLYMSY